ncbi:MAG: hypothetical protein K2X91_03865, partial [Thermoleophilia bacterium]|nr:hypothetical protein [Thermoleophilia bacterium]
RQWVLLSAALVYRRLWDLLPAGLLREAVEYAERAAHPLAPEVRSEWCQRIDAAVPTAVGAAELAQRQIVKSCDPDAADIDAPVLSRPNQIAPAFPLFQAASRNARNSIESIAEALTEAAQAVRALYTEPNEEMLGRVRDRTEEAADTRTTANRSANNALRMKQEGDDLADRAAASKNKRIEEAIAVEKVRKMEEGSVQRGGDDFDAEDRRERAARKLLAGLLREIVGNPFTPPRFEAAWRTSTVVALAQGIYDERAFDRLPILADALLDADCDEEAVLRHCRGTELHAKETVNHVRGCWVIEQALNRFESLPPPKPGDKKRPRRRERLEDLDIGFPLDLGDDRLA